MNLYPMPKAGIEQRATSLSELGFARPNRLQLIAELYAAIQLAGEWFNHNCYNLAARFNHYAAFMQQAR